MLKIFIQCIVLIVIPLFLGGCVSFRTSNAVPRRQDQMIHHLKKSIKGLNHDLYRIELKKERELAELRELQKKLKLKLKKEIKNRNASVTIEGNSLSIRFLSKIFFGSGKAKITEEGKTALDKIVPALLNSKSSLRIEGHTDNSPIRRTKNLYRSNWELSSDRSLSVLTHLLSKGISGKRLSIVAYGQNKPIANNSTAKGRMQNRRVEIVIAPPVQIK